VLGLMALILIPALLIGTALLVVAAGVYGIRRMFTRSKQPGGVFDGRRNVRVIVDKDSIV
jgi:hypothetical protein